MNRGWAVAERVRHVAGLLLLLAVAWSTPLGMISPDTKTDLYVDPTGFMARALHLWDPQVSWGVMQNQGYGYLFPMGPFFTVLGAVLPMWVAQRLWWSLLLIVGYLGMLWLMRELGLRRGWALHVAALSYALAPRIITTLGGLSSEALPALMAPLILAPLVAASLGRMGPRRAAAFSGLAVLACGGVNATATLLALVPAGVWMVTRAAWWRQRLTWLWAMAMVFAASWWALPLLLLGRYSPPFLDWIENARMVSRPIGLFDVIRGTTHWLGHLLTPQGPWWPAGHQLVSDPWVILATAVIAGLGLAGLARGDAPHRRFLIVVLLIGVLLIALPHSGTLASPLSGPIQQLLDGPLSPLRNVHKADPLIRMALTIGLAHLLATTRGARRADRRALDGGLTLAGVSWRVHRMWTALVVVAAASVVWAATPGIEGNLAPRGTFAAIPHHWLEAAEWLDGNAGADRSLILPASSFGEYTWGRPLDEPLRPLTDAPYAVRDAVPLTPANTIRFLDAIESRLQSGRDLNSAIAALARTGVRYLVLRNDLDTAASGQPPVLFAGASIRSTSGVRLVAQFGEPVKDLAGGRSSAVEIYEIDRTVADAVEVWPLSSAVAASGASEALPALAELPAAAGPIVFDGDAEDHVKPTERLETDSYRARDRFFGFTRGQDVSSSLTRSADAGADYRPWEQDDLRSTVEVSGAREVVASSSIAEDESIIGLRPAFRPLAAFDGDVTTAWLAFGDRAPTLEAVFDEPVATAGLRITPFENPGIFGPGLAVATRVLVVTDAGERTYDLDPIGGSQPVPGAGDLTYSVRVEILDTTAGPPGSTLTGLAEVTIPAAVISERVALPAGPSGRTQAVIVGSGSVGASDGCVLAGTKRRCVAGQFRAAEETVALRRDVTVQGEGEFRLSGTITANPLHPLRRLLVGPEFESITASSSRALGPAGAPSAAFDQDRTTAWSPAPDDRAPRLTATMASEVTVSGIHVVTRDRWASRHAVFVRVTVDGQERFGRLAAEGRMTFDPMTGRTVSVSLVHDALAAGASASLEVEELSLAGAAWSAPAAGISTECGEGPGLSVNGVPLPTRVSGSREAALGFGSMSWESCVDVGLGYLPVDRIDIASWEGMAPDTALITRSDGGGGDSAEAPITPTGLRDLERPSATEFVGRLDDGPPRLLVTVENANPGWVATIDGVSLTPLTVDGFRQGFVVPEGMQGEVSIRYAPDGPYRAALGGGLLLALLLVPLALLPDSRRRSLAGQAWTVPSVAPPVVAILLGLGLAGLWGGLVAGLATGVTQIPQVGKRCAYVVASLVITAGAIEALAPQIGLRGAGLEVTTRILALLAVVAVVGQLGGRVVPRDSDSSAPQHPA